MLVLYFILRSSQFHHQLPSFEEFQKMDAFTAHEHHGDLKDRYNYASSQCAASVLKVNKEVKGGSRILNDNRDSYMLTPCSVKDKYIVVELCEDILIDTIVLGNFEYFSSTFKHFKVSVSQRYPPSQGWVALGEFDAVNSKRKQMFSISNPIIFAKFVKIDFVSHFDYQYYCPLSLVQVYGTSMIEEYKRFVDDAVYVQPLSLPSSKNESKTPYPQKEEDYFLLDNPDFSNLGDQHAAFVEEWLNYCRSKDFHFYFSNQCFSANDAYKSQEDPWEIAASALPQSVFTSLERNHIKLIKHIHSNNLKISEKFNKIDKKVKAMEKAIANLNSTIYDEIAKLRITFDLFEKKQKKQQLKAQGQLKQQVTDLKFKLERIFEETIENRKWDRLRSLLIILILIIVMLKNTNIKKYASSAFYYYSPGSSPKKDMKEPSGVQSMPSSPLSRKRAQQ
eukprot:NODE_11_length_46995_cov_0.451872.p10 type:complete len:449 gc:universal NODE_11_length_46995_cov_0.451872:17162-18508(+)